jgi:hypothetical protein
MTDLRTALRLDAVASGATGVLLLALAGVLDGLLGLPVALSLAVGAFFLVWAAFCAWVSVDVAVPYVREVVVLNSVWVAVSVVFAFAGWVELTALGVAFVLAQAAVVAVFVALQVVGLRRVRTAVA